MKAIEFHKLCGAHDWYYAYSDDSEVYSRGRASESNLRSIAHSNPEFARILKAWEDYIKSPNDAKVERPTPQSLGISEE